MGICTQQMFHNGGQNLQTRIYGEKYHKNPNKCPAFCPGKSLGVE